MADDSIREGAWRRALMDNASDGVLVLDAHGQVLEMNRAFGDMLGYGSDDGPYLAPYPWWPTQEEDADALATLSRDERDPGFPGGEGLERVFYRCDRSPVQVQLTGASVPHASSDELRLLIVRNITRDKAAQQRRSAAAEVSRSFATVDDLSDLIAVAEHGLGLLFDGDCTVRIGDGVDRLWLGPLDRLDPAALPAAVLDGLEGQRSADSVNPRPGILILPPSPDVDCRAWVQFPLPRRIPPEEMIAADLLATGLAGGLQRLEVVHRSALREDNLQRALESHRVIGQATGILVERHRVRPGEAFEMLRRASQNRNLKLRDLAARVIESGADPAEA